MEDVKQRGNKLWALWFNRLLTIGHRYLELAIIPLRLKKKVKDSSQFKKIGRCFLFKRLCVFLKQTYSFSIVFCAFKNVSANICISMFLLFLKNTYTLSRALSSISSFKFNSL